MAPDNYGQEMDDGMEGDYQPNGMFGGGQEGEMDGEEEPDEYFDDAGDIGYLPADHVSFKFNFLMCIYSP